MTAVTACESDREPDVEDRGEEGEEPVEGDEAQLDIVAGEEGVQSGQVGGHLGLD